MSSKTTVAIDKKLRKKLKKIAFFLDITQNDVIERALELLEQNVIKQVNKSSNKTNNASRTQIENVLNDISEKVCQADPEHKKVQDVIYSGPKSIDDVIISSWNVGLDLE